MCVCVCVSVVPWPGAVGCKPHVNQSSGIFHSCLVFLYLQTVLQWIWLFFIKSLIFLNDVPCPVAIKKEKVSGPWKNLSAQSAWPHAR